MIGVAHCMDGGDLRQDCWHVWQCRTRRRCRSTRTEARQTRASRDCGFASASQVRRLCDGCVTCGMGQCCIRFASCARLPHLLRQASAPREAGSSPRPCAQTKRKPSLPCHKLSIPQRSAPKPGSPPTPSPRPEMSATATVTMPSAPIVIPSSAGEAGQGLFRAPERG